MIKVTRPNVVIEMTAEEWDLLLAYLVQLDYPDFHQKMGQSESAALTDIVRLLRGDSHEH
jgi:hypothetical protein